MNDELFREVRPVRASTSLRTRVLVAAEAELRRPRWWQTFGFGRWDLAWAATAVALVTIHALLAVGERPQVFAAVRPPADPEVVALARELGLPPGAFQVAQELLSSAQARELDLLLNERL